MPGSQAFEARSSLERIESSNLDMRGFTVCCSEVSGVKKSPPTANCSSSDTRPSEENEYPRKQSGPRCLASYFQPHRQCVRLPSISGAFHKSEKKREAQVCERKEETSGRKESRVEC